MTALATGLRAWPSSHGRRATPPTPLAARLRAMHPAEHLLTALMVGGLLAVILAVGFAL